jgi:hypothetical protein
VLVDLDKDDRIAMAVGADFLIGVFKQRATGVANAPTCSALVVEDPDVGPVPAGAAEFELAKQRLVEGLPPGSLSCEEPDRACVSMSEGATTHMEIVRLKGRVARITVGCRSPNPNDDLRPGCAMRRRCSWTGCARTIMTASPATRRLGAAPGFGPGPPLTIEHSQSCSQLLS